MPREGVQAGLPERAVVFQPRRRLAKRLDLHAAMVLPADHVAVDQPGPLEHFHVLRDGVQRHGKLPGDLGDGGRFPAQGYQNGAPGRIRDRPEHPIQDERAMLNHLVESYARPYHPVKDPEDVPRFQTSRAPRRTAPRASGG